ncbi:nicotinate-nucleotide--dimethylbenzimidazole phosphoribosyltransferase [Sunxiuqinia elliptica]|uniref:Nicotinate-nucleotide--dimethylbenzimidazole phosphoribosyltransferase n=1 Tax=Sunxiuqinia elliptica TaxID=655355 RepID=A0A4R6H1F6_9BACT|nr:nicotinate-nucleotide--dimethylbenzimidazole phosphoribosyltransferase [Sunxiuqinia elliptica]TDO01191.1 nicotinate-nucleotide-dimethylbenzimidazole phosphoribosyltransferase [Sunxiuqinia elliptica]TDO57702.1 nicotinate-nucleotide-dimethylbenzimidazole phosphoribosyltransferase [Sunxiuqinia elliptica]
MHQTDFEIPGFSDDLREAIQHKLDNKAKPVGSLGRLESLAKQVALIQNSLTPQLNNPVMLTVAADHGITAEGVSPCPVEITWQQVHNFLSGGGGIGLLSRVYGMDLHVVDAGVNYDFKAHPKLIDAKVAKGSRNFLKEPAMTDEECMQAFNNGRSIVASFHEKGSNIIGFGEMGIGNTTPASALMSIICKLPVNDCVGPGAGLDNEGVLNKCRVIEQAIEKHGISSSVLQNLARFGGFEIATIAGGMFEAATRRMVILVDGFITTGGLLVAQELNRKVLDYCVFAHVSDEQGHQKMLAYMQADPLLSFGLRLGEGTGAALAYPMIKGAVAVLSEMTSFEEAQVINTSHIRFEGKGELQSC